MCNIHVPEKLCVESYCKIPISGSPSVVQESVINGLVKSFPCVSQKKLCYVLRLVFQSIITKFI